MTEGDINRTVAMVTQDIIKAAHLSIPQSLGRPGKQSYYG